MNMFVAFGEVAYVYLVRDLATGLSRGYGFFSFYCWSVSAAAWRSLGLIRVGDGVLEIGEVVTGMEGRIDQKEIGGLTGECVSFCEFDMGIWNCRWNVWGGDLWWTELCCEEGFRSFFNNSRRCLSSHGLLRSMCISRPGERTWVFIQLDYDNRSQAWNISKHFELEK